MRLHEHMLETGLTIHGQVYVIPYVIDDVRAVADRSKVSFYEHKNFAYARIWHLFRPLHDLTALVVRSSEIRQGILSDEEKQQIRPLNALCFVEGEVHGVFAQRWTNIPLFYPLVPHEELYGWGELTSMVATLQRLVLDVLQDKIPELSGGV